MIAMAIINDPDLIIADEPTTALDVTVQAQILETLLQIRDETGAAIMMITHDLGVVAGIAARVQVMYGGTIVESGPVEDIFAAAADAVHGRAARLGAATRSCWASRSRPIHGAPPSLLHLPPGCTFGPRCPLVEPECREAEPELVPARRPRAHRALPALAARSRELEQPQRLFLRAEIVHHADDRGRGGRPRARREHAPAARGTRGRRPCCAVRDLVKHFPVRGGGIIPRTVGQVQAVSGVSFDVAAGETLGLVGESGCGKSTVGRGRAAAAAGHLRFGAVRRPGADRAPAAPAARRCGGDLQIVFQDPYASLNPRWTINNIVAEPLHIHGVGRPRRAAPGGRAAGDRRAEPGAPQPLPARVLRRAAAADRDRPGAGAVARS